MINGNHYYLYSKYNFNGNDVFFVQDKDYSKHTNNLSEAMIFNHLEADLMMSKMSSLNKVLVQDAQRLACEHAPVSKLKKVKLEKGDICLLLSKRDTTGKNASFHAYAGYGYTSDWRACEVYTYDPEADRHNRSFEYFVKLSRVMKVSEKRVDHQDLRADESRHTHHSVMSCKETIERRKVKEREDKPTGIPIEECA